MAIDWDDQLRARAGEHLPPKFQAGRFHCGWCRVLTKQSWVQLGSVDELRQRGFSPGSSTPVKLSEIWRCTCANCYLDSYWLERNGENPAEQLWPFYGSAPVAHEDMPEDVRKDYAEAAGIVARSPRGACALLRYALQSLMGAPELEARGAKGKNLDADIGALVASGLDVQVQQALDVLRVVGNNAVHPLELDLRDDTETASSLFTCLNEIIEEMIAKPKRMASLFSALPEGARDAIERRDGHVD